MKKQKTNLFLLLIIILLVTISCRNSNKSIEGAANSSQDDDYAVLRGTAVQSHKIVENLSGKLINITEKEFIERVTALDNPKGFQYLGETPCIVQLHADWCQPCWVLSGVLVDVAPEYKGRVIFYRVNVDRSPRILDVFKVESVPVIFYFKPREQMVQTVGLLKKDELRKAINEILLND